MEEQLNVSLIVGADRPSRKLLTDVLDLERTLSALSISYATTRARALELLAAPCHILVFSGHGYARDEWSMSGTDKAIVHEADLPAQFNASFIIADTCNVSPREWLSRTGEGVSLAGWSDSDDYDNPAIVSVAQARWVADMAAAAAAGFATGPDHPAYGDWTPGGLRATWDQCLSRHRSFRGPARYWTFPVS